MVAPAAAEVIDGGVGELEADPAAAADEEGGGGDAAEALVVVEDFEGAVGPGAGAEAIAGLGGEGPGGVFDPSGLGVEGFDAELAGLEVEVEGEGAGAGPVGALGI